jgi:hypothetical protein
VVLCGLCLAAGLCAAPVALDIRGGKILRLGARYLWFRRNVTRTVGNHLRRAARDFLETPDLLGTLELYGPLFRHPLRLGPFRLDLAFSTGDAAETALLHGRLCLFLNFLYLLPSRGRPEVTLKPCFLSRRELSLDCDISVTMPAAVFLFRTLSLSVRRSIHAGKQRRSHV